MLILSKSVAFNIKKEKTASLMMTLSCMYERLFAANKVHLIKKLFTMKMAEGEGFGEQLSDFIEVMDQLNTIKIAFSDEVRALMILEQLPES